MFTKFSNYLEARKDGVGPKEGLVGDAKVKLVADYDGPQPKSPEKGEGQDAPAPYKAANGDVAAKKGEKGLADLGDKTLIYEPDTKGGNSKFTALGKELESWPKAGKLAKTEQFINDTKQLSARDFVKYMSKNIDLKDLPTITAFSEGQFHPNPTETFRYVSALAAQDKRYIENLVFDLKRAGTLGSLLEAALQHSEAYEILTMLFADENGNHRANKLAKAMRQYSEAVGPPLGTTPNTNFDGDQPDDIEDPDFNDDDDSEGEDETNPDEESDDSNDMDSDDQENMDDMGDEEPKDFPAQDHPDMPHERLKNALHKTFMRHMMSK